MRRDAGGLLERALVRDAAACGIAAALEPAGSTSWASATFVGARHAWRVPCDATHADWARRLPGIDFTLAGHLVADLSVAVDGEALVIAALTVELA